MPPTRTGNAASASVDGCSSDIGRPGRELARRQCRALASAPLVAPLRALRTEHAQSLGAGATATPWRAAESIGATRAGAELRATLGTLAAERYPASAPDRRALEAELLDETEELFATLDTLTVASQRLGVAPDRERVSAWRAWCATLAQTLAVADRCWARVVPALREAGAGR